MTDTDGGASFLHPFSVVTGSLARARTWLNRPDLTRAFASNPPGKSSQRLVRVWVTLAEFLETL